MAWDIHTLDKVLVLMTKGQVISLLGAPDQTEDINNTWQVKNIQS